ncbi:MAG: flavodoxin family protein [Gaiellaceae bacterium]
METLSEECHGLATGNQGHVVKILVVYYSRTGRTKQVAETVAAGLGADLAAIEGVDNRAGVLGYFWAGRDGLFGRCGSIHSTETEPAGYDLVLVGTPVWAGRLSAPVRTYIANHKTDLRHVAFFCTEGGYGGPRVFKTMNDLSGQQPVATLEITGGDLRSGRYRDKVSAFTRHITDSTKRGAKREGQE